MSLARAELESLLRTRQLDRTLTTAIPSPDPHDDSMVAPAGHPALDAVLGGGFPRGQLSELAGPRSSGRMSLLLHLMAAATTRGELVACVDALDMLDVESAAAAGIDSSRLLWIRGHVVTSPGFCRDTNQRAMEQAIRALTLVLQAGNFGLVAFDAGEAPLDALRRLPFTTWMRLQRMVEGSQTVCILVGSEPMARSSAGLTVRLTPDRDRSACGHAEPRTCESEARHQRQFALGVPPSRQGRYSEPRQSSSGLAPSGGGGPQRNYKDESSELGSRFGNQLFEGLEVNLRVVRARGRAADDTRIALTTRAAAHV